MGKTSLHRNFPSLQGWFNRSTCFKMGQSCVYLLNNGPKGRTIEIQEREGLDEHENKISRWAVVMDDYWCLGKDDQYHWEPQPSNRTDEFIALTRFDTLEAAYEALYHHEANTTNPQSLTVNTPINYGESRK